MIMTIVSVQWFTAVWLLYQIATVVLQLELAGSLQKGTV